MLLKRENKKIERKHIKGRILASKVSGFRRDKVVFYIKHNGVKKRFIALLKDDEEAKGYYSKYPQGAFVEIEYFDAFFPLIIKMEKI